MSRFHFLFLLSHLSTLHNIGLLTNGLTLEVVTYEGSCETDEVRSITRHDQLRLDECDEVVDYSVGADESAE